MAEGPAFSLRMSRRTSDPVPLDAEQGNLVAKRPKLNEVAHQSLTEAHQLNSINPSWARSDQPRNLLKINLESLKEQQHHLDLDE